MGLVAPPTNYSSIPPKSESGDTAISANDIDVGVRDTFINKSAIVPETYPDIYGTLLSFTEGIPVIVEYFKRRAPYINTQSIDTSFSAERSSVHFSFDLVHNFEIRLKENLEISIDPATTETAINGVAIIYPGFKPNVGDMFYMKLPDAKIGVFIVNITQPLTITRGTHYQIEFHFDGFLTAQTEERMKTVVSEEFWFDKQRYFSDEAALLTSKSYNQLELLVKCRSAIISRLMNKFYNTSEKTIVRPDGIYDPFLVEYLTNKITIRDSRRDLCQIFNPFINKFDNTIWQAFLNQDISTLMFIGYTLHYYQQYLYDVNTSNIDKFRVVSLVDPYTPFDVNRFTPAKFEITDLNFRTVNYVFSNRFYYAILKSFEQAGALTAFTDDDKQAMLTDSRIFENLSNDFYSFVDNTYHSIDFFDTLSIGTGSNNDLHLPEMEFIIFDFIINNNINIIYLTEKVLNKFPFSTMKPLDQLYYSASLLNIIDSAINRIR